MGGIAAAHGRFIIMGDADDSYDFGSLGPFLTKNEGLMPEDPRLNKLFRVVKLETGLAVGFSLIAIGLAGSVWALSSWGARSFGVLEPSLVLRIVIPATLALTLGSQIALSSFFLSVLGLGRLRRKR